MTIATVPNATVPKGSSPRFTQPELSAIRNILEEYLRKKWIQSSCSPHAAPAMLAPKRGDPPGSPGSCLVVNYHPLTAVTIAPGVPLPVIEGFLASLHGANLFRTLYMEQGSHQVRMAPEDRHKTALRTFIGQFEWRFMPFGLKSAPSTFQATMNSIFFDMLGQGVLIHVDDVLIYTATFEDHLRLLDSVLARLLHDKYPKLEKCQFAAQSIEYLGYRVGADGIHPSTEKLSAIALWPAGLANETQVRQFLGTVNYCSNYMVLEQDGKPLGFLGKCLSDAEMRYSTYDQELLAIVRALERWRHSLIAAEHLSIVYQPGATNVVADALPRCPVYEQDPQHASSKVLSVLQIESNTNAAPSHESPSPLLHDKVQASPQSSLSDLEMQGVGDEAWEAALQRCSEFGAAYKRAPETQPEPVLIPDLGRSKLVDRVLFMQLQGLWRICVAHFPCFPAMAMAPFSLWWTVSTDGQTERATRTIEQMLRTYIQSREEEWPDLLPALEVPTTAPVTLLLGYPLLSPAAYKLQLPPSIPIHPVRHGSLLSAHCPRPQDMASPPEWKAIGKASDGLPIHEVESILDQQGEGDATRYLVKWKGFPDSDAAWEPLSNLDNCAALLRAFRTSRKAQLRRQTQRVPPSRM
ncbi:hypothetical protein Esti_005687 [Eimeria stiedai]